MVCTKNTIEKRYSYYFRRNNDYNSYNSFILKKSNFSLKLYVKEQRKLSNVSGIEESLDKTFFFFLSLETVNNKNSIKSRFIAFESRRCEP